MAESSCSCAGSLEALFNIAVSNAGGLLLVWMGYLLARIL
jgi:fluoride ion exporter CrcB/FEX